MRNEMSKEMFAEKVAMLVGGTVKEITKTNGIKHTGIIVELEGTSCAPTVYIDEQYDAGLSISETVDYVKGVVSKTPVLNLDFSWICDFEKVKDKLRIGLVNEAMNEHIEVSKNALSYGFPDLIMFPYIQVGDNETTKVKNSQLELWGVKPDDVFNIGLLNMENDVIIERMNEVLISMGMPEEIVNQMEIPMKVVRRKNGGMYGAAAILTRAVRKMLPEKFVVLPSSVWEVLVLPLGDTTENAMELCNLIAKVNREQVAPEEVLSNKPYYFE